MSPAGPPESRKEPRQGFRFERGGRFARSLFLAFLLLGIALFFWLPTRFPVPVNLSESYLFQFNNRIAQKILALLLVGGFLAAKTLGLQLPSSKRRGGQATYPGVPTLILVLVFAAVLCVLTCWLAIPLGGMGDGAFFIDRIHHIRMGAHPYRDFEWVYGSFPLYASAFLAKIFHLSDVGGYDALYVAETLAGIWMLWWGVAALELPTGGKRAAFLLYLLLGLVLIPSMQMNYTLFRYSLALFCVTGWARLDRSPTLLGRIGTVAASALLVALLLWMYPEVGMAFAASTAVFLPMRRYAMRRPFVVDTLVAWVLFFATYKLFDRSGEFTTLKSFAAGAYNMPLYPDPQMLVLLVSLLTVGAYLATGRLREHLSTNIAFSGIFGVAMLAGALGRADPIHVMGYELGLICCALTLLWQWPVARAVVWFVAVMALVLIPEWNGRYDVVSFYQQLVLINMDIGRGPQTPALLKAERWFIHKNPLERQSWVSAGINQAYSPIPRDFDPHTVFPGSSPVLFAVFPYLPNGASVYESPHMDEGYYFGVADIAGDGAVQRKLAELQAHPERDLVLPERSTWPCILPANPGFLRSVLLYPFPPYSDRSYVLFVPLCGYLEANYRWVYPPAAQTYGYGLARHK
jgi:hypothetical protein